MAAPFKTTANIEGRECKIYWNGKLYGTKAYVEATPLDSFAKNPTPYKANFDSKTGTITFGTIGTLSTARAILHVLEQAGIEPFAGYDFSPRYSKVARRPAL